MHVAVSKGGNVPLVRFTNGVIVVEVGVPVDEDVVDSGAKQTGDFQVEKLREFVGDKG